MIGWVPFHNPVQLPMATELLWLFPLCVAVGVVYKAVRVDHVRQLPRQSVGVFLYMVGGLIALGAAFWAFLAWWP